LQNSFAAQPVKLPHQDRMSVVFFVDQSRK
jgi:hypothetical protein